MKDLTLILMARLFFITRKLKLEDKNNAKSKNDILFLLKKCCINKSEVKADNVTYYRFIKRMINQNVLLYSKTFLYVDINLLFQTIYNYDLNSKYMTQLIYFEADDIKIPYEEVIKTQTPRIENSHLNVKERERLEKIWLI